uniref:Uncharacterized protein n=1 Tax=Panagrolaimus sp. PS1159 TaxID=55785 RepID=A0AC35GS49_9BILA
MSTKNDKYSFFEQSFATSENPCYNLNLNQRKKCPKLIPVQSNSKPKNDKYCEKERLQLSSKTSTFTTLNEDNIDFKKQWKNENTLNTTNKSALSLHIGAYRNPIETAASDLFNDENIEGLKKEKIGSIKTSKQCFIDNLKSRNPFEFPRQQNRNKPEVMQYSTSQRLLDSQPPTSFRQIGNNSDGQMVQPQMPHDDGTSYKKRTFKIARIYFFNPSSKYLIYKKISNITNKRINYT